MDAIKTGRFFQPGTQLQKKFTFILQLLATSMYNKWPTAASALACPQTSKEGHISVIALCHSKRLALQPPFPSEPNQITPFCSKVVGC
jgi:hypothetical protein